MSSKNMNTSTNASRASSKLLHVLMMLLQVVTAASLVHSRVACKPRLKNPGHKGLGFWV